jgi:spermidine synthase
MRDAVRAHSAGRWLPAAILLLTAFVPGAGSATPEVVRADRASPYGRVRVSDHPSTGLRCLAFPPGRALQSCMQLDDPSRLVFPYTRAMAATLAVPQHLQRLLQVGLGGGSLVRWVQRYLPGLRQDVVEIDPVVVDVARELFFVDASRRLRITVMDGRAFLAGAAASYDLIWLDAYGPDSVPAHLTTVEFFRLVRARLAPGGAVAANLWGPGVNPRYHSQVRAIQDVFPETYVLAEGSPGEAGTNGPGLAAAAGSCRIVVGSLGPRLGAAAWAAAATTLQQRQRLDLDLAALVREQYHLISEEPAPAAARHDPPTH